MELVVNGRQGIFNLRFFPVMDDGFIIGSILLLEDITEYILDQRKDFLSDSLASIGLLAASVAHEVNNPKTNLKIVFSDTGTGIEESRNLFAPFYSTKDQDRQNSGLGLSVCYSIIKKYEGSIALNNLKTRGCETVIILPLVYRK